MESMLGVSHYTQLITERMNFGKTVASMLKTDLTEWKMSKHLKAPYSLSNVLFKMFRRKTVMALSENQLKTH